MEPKAPLANCNACPLRDAQAAHSDPFKPGARFTIVGESPGKEEVNTGRGFTGWSGKFLWNVMGQLGVTRDECNVTNAVLCIPPPSGEEKQDMMGAAVACCRPRLINELKQMDGTILALGRHARDAIFGPADEHEDGGTLHGRWCQINVGGVLRDAISTVHPAYILREPDEAKTIFDDITKAVRTTRDTDVRIAHPTYEVVSASRVPEVLKHLSTFKHIAYDIESDQLDFRYDAILLLVMAVSPDHAYIFPGTHPQSPGDVLYSQAHEPWWKEFWASDAEFIGHNTKFDQRFLRWQIGWTPRCDFDTMLAHYALDERKGTHGLKQIASRYLNIRDYERGIKQYLKSKNDVYRKIPFTEICQYAAGDAVCTWALRFKLEELMIADGTHEKPFKSLLMPMAKLFHDCEMKGIKIDVDHLDATNARFQHELDEIAAEMLSMSNGIVTNINSFHQLAIYIYDVLHLPTPRGKISARATNREAMVKLEQEPSVQNNPFTMRVISLIRRYRRISKMKSSYVENLLERLDDDECTHYEVQIHGAEHGRISIRNPALQTIPRADDQEEGEYGKVIKDAFLARPGYTLVSVDYSQSELRVAAALANCAYFIQAYKDNRDVHAEVAFGMYGQNYSKEQRHRTKMFNFSYLYGGTEYSFAKDAGLPIEVARQFIKDYDRLTPELAVWKKSQFDDLKRYGFVVGRTGRKRRIPFISQANADDARKASFNAVDSGPASDLTVIAAIRLAERGYTVLITVHDSVVLEVETGRELEVAREAVKIMEQVGEEVFPEVTWKADAEIGVRWGTMTSVKI